ncbi:tyrosine-type recombinase/integrase [Rhodococcoides kroppenstedtii]|uniref:tyrosine-type recombinase/integrase n=1 Tax=Rhodococcoides kroppenstedtii TaxID=293050 RepID=UPI0028E8CE2A|nr:tyrosine-type recombinase/integrase [Rhodococcus kroppenstedtii]
MIAVGAAVAYGSANRVTVDTSAVAPAPASKIGPDFRVEVIGDSYTGGSNEGGVGRAGWPRLVNAQLDDNPAGLTYNVVADGLGGSGYSAVGPNGKRFLAMAVRDRRVLANAATGVSLPRARKSDPVFLTADQAFALAGCAGPGELPVLVLSQTGLRWGELAGMKVKRWDPARRRLRVAEAVTEVNGHIVWGTPKSHHLRSVAVAPWLAERIDAAVDGRVGDDLLFPSPQGSVLRNKNARRSWFDRAVVEAGVPRITPQDLRHTAASLAISAGANVKAVQRMLGHASAVMTLDLYGHLFEDDLDDVAARMPAPPALAPVVGLSAVR